MPPRDADPGQAELEVLSILWDVGPATVREVLNALHERGRELAYTTVMTFLTRLEQKGLVRSDRSGVAYVYSPIETRENITRSRLQSIRDVLFNGASGPLVVQLIREGSFTADEISELQQLIESLDAADAARNRGRRSRNKRGKADRDVRRRGRGDTA